MGKGKQPYIPLYTGDYLKKTRRLTLEVRGAWVDLLIFMWESDEKGTITGTLDEFALMLGCNLKKANAIITDLQEKKVCDFEILPDGKIKLISRRMIRDVELSQVRKQAGAKGGNPNLLNQNSTKEKNFGYRFSDNENEVASGILDLKKIKESFQKIEDGLFSDQIFIEKLKMTHKDKDLKQAFKECFVHHSESETPPTEIWQWRQKLNTWLTIKPMERKIKSVTKRNLTLEDLDA